MADPFTIRIFVPDGDPEGVRLIDRMNWTGLGLVFPREKWPETRNRPEFARTGIYILVGYKGEPDELPTLYIGQADGVKNRIDEHFQKDFWTWAIMFVSASNGLNRAHVLWLEHALVKRAQEAKRSHLDNGNAPQEPGLSQSEKADTQGFLKEILQILPLVGLRAFEIPKAVAMPKAPADPISAGLKPKHEKDTIIVPAQKEGFEQAFLGEDSWYAIRIAGGMLPKIKYIAAYQTQPISAVTHYAPVDRIEPYGEEGKYRLIFSAKAKPLEHPIPFADAPGGAMQGPRYTSFERLKTAKKLIDLV
jgi:hypothetical protein